MGIPRGISLQYGIPKGAALKSVEGFTMHSFEQSLESIALKPWIQEFPEGEDSGGYRIDANTRDCVYSFRYGFSMIVCSTA